MPSSTSLRGIGATPVERTQELSSSQLCYKPYAALAFHSLAFISGAAGLQPKEIAELEGTMECWGDAAEPQKGGTRAEGMRGN